VVERENSAIESNDICFKIMFFVFLVVKEVYIDMWEWRGIN